MFKKSYQYLSNPSRCAELVSASLGSGSTMPNPKLFIDGKSGTNLNQDKM